MISHRRRVKNGLVETSHSLDEVINCTAGIKLEYSKVVSKEVNNIRRKIVNEIKKIIKSGGAGLKSDWSWSYWERNKGEKNFRLKKGSNIKFDNRFSHRGKSVLRLPVHPTTYLRLRTKRYKPNIKEYALWDTGTYLKSFVVTDTRTTNGTKVDLITNLNQYFREMENGYNTRFGIVKRPHIAPALQNFNKNNKDLLDNLGLKLSKVIDRKMSKVTKV